MIAKMFHANFGDIKTLISWQISNQECFSRYEAIIENGQIKWLTDAPKVSKAKVIVTILPDTVPQVSRRVVASSIALEGRTLGDLVSPMIEEQDCPGLK